MPEDKDSRKSAKRKEVKGPRMTENEIARVIVELKSVEAVSRVHKKQLLTYLRLADKRLGLLINFGEELIKDGISRVVNGLQQ